MLSQTRGGRARLPRRQAKAVHAGVDVQRGVERATECVRRFRPFVDFRKRTQRRTQAGDIILAVNGQAVRNLVELADRLEGQQVGDQVILTLDRGGQRLEVGVTLEGGRPGS